MAGEGEGEGWVGGAPVLGHKTTYYGYQGDGYGPLRDHNTMLLPREILHLGPSGPQGAPVGFNRPSIKRANTEKRCFSVRGRERYAGAPPTSPQAPLSEPIRTPPGVSSRTRNLGIFVFLAAFWRFEKGKLWHFFDLGFRFLDCENSGLRCRGGWN